MTNKVRLIKSVIRSDPGVYPQLGLDLRGRGLCVKAWNITTFSPLRRSVSWAPRWSSSTATPSCYTRSQNETPDLTWSHTVRLRLCTWWHKVRGIHSENKQKVMLTCFPFASKLALSSVYTFRFVVFFFSFLLALQPGHTPKTPNLSDDTSAGRAQGPKYLGHIWPSLRNLK